MDSQHSVCFVTAVNPDDDIQPVRLLLASLRECGGSLKGSPVYVFSPEPGRLEQAAALPGVEVMQLEQPGPAGHYTLVGKVFACARAEALLAGSGCRPGLAGVAERDPGGGGVDGLDGRMDFFVLT